MLGFNFFKKNHLGAKLCLFYIRGSTKLQLRIYFLKIKYRDYNIFLENNLRIKMHVGEILSN